jgi:DeoR/GlpR family transcriptional regulator of sugar metabolism
VILLILRQKQILEKLEGEGEITIKELATRFNVSEMTVHRDVDALQKQNYVYKKRGAVVYIENNDRTNSDFYAEEKRAIGIRAASLFFFCISPRKTATITFRLRI